jgi:CheY-like chemotaxis protein
MNKNGAIIVIEDDKDDRELLQSVFDALEVKNEIIFFSDGSAALDHLNDFTVQPFLILSDVNLPKINGLELKKIVQKNALARLRRIPFIFFTTSPDTKSLQDAYSESVQGFFIKPSDYARLEDIIKTILLYWRECKSPEYSSD